MRTLLIGIFLALVAVSPVRADLKRDCNNLRSARNAIFACSRLLYLGVKDPVKRAIILKNRGFAYARLRDYRGAIIDYTHAIKLHPRYSEAYRLRGIAYEHRYEDLLAERDYNQAIRLWPRNAPAYNNRGLLYRRRAKSARVHGMKSVRAKEEGYNRQAMADYTKAILSNPRYAPAYWNRGVLYQYLGNRAKAIADYRNANGLRHPRAAARLREMGVKP